MPVQPCRAGPNSERASCPRQFLSIFRSNEKNKRTIFGSEYRAPSRATQTIQTSADCVQYARRHSVPATDCTMAFCKSGRTIIGATCSAAGCQGACMPARRQTNPWLHGLGTHSFGSAMAPRARRNATGTADRHKEMEGDVRGCGCGHVQRQTSRTRPFSPAAWPIKIESSGKGAAGYLPKHWWIRGIFDVIGW